MLSYCERFIISFINGAFGIYVSITCCRHVIVQHEFGPGSCGVGVICAYYSAIVIGWYRHGLD